MFQPWTKITSKILWQSIYQLYDVFTVWENWVRSFITPAFLNNFLLLPPLCVSTSQRVLRMPFAGQNHFFGEKTYFSLRVAPKPWQTPFYACFSLLFLHFAFSFLFFCKWRKKKKKTCFHPETNIFQTANIVRSTRLLVEIHHL